ncbi:MAG: hypothetical protein KJN63_00075 [Acidimicrobiia bacterium]|nr:hypothetical protein [Acidimicrobiia bacterium]
MDDTVAKRLGRWLGIGLYLAVGLFYMASGLVVPVVPWLILLNVLWVAGLVVAWRASSERWWIALVSGPIAWIFWLLYVTVGEALLGWTA